MKLPLSPRGELKPFKGDFFLWKYVPPVPAAVIFVIIFLVLSIAHTWKMWQRRVWFCLPFVIGGYRKSIPLILTFFNRFLVLRLQFRVYPCYQVLTPRGSRGYWVCWSRSCDKCYRSAASIYSLVKFYPGATIPLRSFSIHESWRIIQGQGPTAETFSIIRVRWLTTTFVVGDVFAFPIQSTGAGLMASGNRQKLGENIVIAGLFIQIIFFGLFVAATTIFHLRYKQYCIHGTYRPTTSFGWLGMLNTLYMTSGLILVRCIFRIIEYIMGADRCILSNEWPFYIFDALLMAIRMAIFYWWYPSSDKQV
jgi:hypothetical protein